MMIEHVSEVNEDDTLETVEAVADAGTWIRIEGPGAGLLVSVLSRDHNVRVLELVEVEPWFFRARVVNSNQEGFQLRGFSISDGTYVSEVEGDEVQTTTEQEGAERDETGDNSVRD